MKIPLVIVSVLALAGIGWLSWQHHLRTSPTVAEETEGDRLASIEAAFLPSAGKGDESRELATDDPEMRTGAAAFFKELGSALTAADRSRLSKLVSGDLMFSYAERSGVLQVRGRQRRSQLMRGFRSGVGNGLAQAAGLLAYDEFDVMRIEKIRDGEMVAYIRWWNDEFEIYTKMRWWLMKTKGGKWVAYDYEDFDQNLRASALIGAMLSGSGGGQLPWMDEFGEVVKVFQGASGVEALTSLPESLDVVDALLAHKLPKGIEGFARIIRSTALLLDGRADDALEEAERIEKVTGGAPITYYQKGSCLAALDRPEEALVEFARYGDMLGWDSDLREMVADCHYALGANDKAIEQVETALAEQANAVGCLCTLSFCLPPERLGEIAERVKKTRDPEASYEYILDYAVDVGRLDVLKAVFAQLKVAHPESDLLEYYEDEIQELETENETPERALEAEVE